jgi:hypothetical protein
MLLKGIEHMSDKSDLSGLPPPRSGARPSFRGTIPHVQLDQFATPELVSDLLEASKTLPHVSLRESRMAGPETFALCVLDSVAFGPPAAFIDDHEFCHLHPAPGGSIHLTLPRTLREKVVELGWAERHPLAGVGLSEHLITVYCPRDSSEVQAIFFLIRLSYNFARGT